MASVPWQEGIAPKIKAGCGDEVSANRFVRMSAGLRPSSCSCCDSSSVAGYSSLLLIPGLKTPGVSPTQCSTLVVLCLFSWGEEKNASSLFPPGLWIGLGAHTSPRQRHPREQKLFNENIFCPPFPVRCSTVHTHMWQARMEETNKYSASCKEKDANAGDLKMNKQRQRQVQIQIQLQTQLLSNL